MTITYLKRLKTEFKPYYGSITVILLLGLVISAIQPACLKISQQIIDRLQKGDSVLEFKRLSVLLVCVFLISGITKYFYNTLRRYVTEKVIIKLRIALYEKIIWLPQQHLDTRRGGEFMSLIQNDLTQINSGVDTFCSILKEPFVFVGLVGSAVYLDPVLSLFTLVAAPVIILFFSKTGEAVKKYSNRNLSEFSDIISQSQESFSGTRIIKIFQLENLFVQRYKVLHDQFFKTLFKSIKVQELTTPLVEFVGACLMVGVLTYGQYRIESGHLTTGGLIAFILALGLAQMPIKNLNNAFLKIKNAEAASQRIYYLLGERGESQTPEGKIYPFSGTIEFRSVNFSYAGSPTLNNINFLVKKGEKIGIVGPSGSGKSTIVNLLSHFYEVTSGDILIDGAPLSQIPLFSLRALISVVTQETFLFHDTIYHNILFGKPTATREEVLAAAKKAHCLEFVDKCVAGFDTVIGDRGILLSGGERQRLAIARAFLKNSPILILDEATSNLDTQSEKIVQEALELLMEGKTTFIIAHRLSTIKKANKILVIKDGHLIETGSHEDLLKEGRVYSDLFKGL